MGDNTSSTNQIIKAASACVWRGNQVLLAQRGKAWGRGMWSLPGGSVEDGETNEQAAARELLEETAVVAALTHHVGDFELQGPRARYIISCWTGFYISGAAIAASDAMDVRWVTVDELPSLNLALNNHEAITRASALLHNL